MTNINLYIYLFFNKDEEAYVILQSLVRPIVMQVKHTMNVPSGKPVFSDADYFALADLTLLKCLYRFHIHQGQPFPAFFRRSLINATLDYCRTEGKRRYTSLYKDMQLDSMVGEEKTEYFVNLITSHSDPTCRRALARDELDRIWKTAALTEMQKRIIYLYMLGYRRSEISRILHIPLQRTDYALRKMKKIRRRID